jgi:hypothetical protein
MTFAHPVKSSVPGRGRRTLPSASRVTPPAQKGVSYVRRRLISSRVAASIGYLIAIAMYWSVCADKSVVAVTSGSTDAVPAFPQ